MKKFRFTRIKSPAPDGIYQKSRLYSIHLAPGVTNYFSSYKNARSFAAEYTRAVNQTLSTFNKALAELYQAHRSAYFYFFSELPTPEQSHLEQRITDHIRGAELWIQRAVFNTSGTYTGGVVCGHLSTIYEHLEKGIETLVGFFADRGEYSRAEDLRLLLKSTRAEFEQIQDHYYKDIRN